MTERSVHLVDPELRGILALMPDFELPVARDAGRHNAPP